jgi:hypothetical protein
MPLCLCARMCVCMQTFNETLTSAMAKHNEHKFCYKNDAAELGCGPRWLARIFLPDVLASKAECQINRRDRFLLRSLELTLRD